jgi:hypothetical protein
VARSRAEDQGHQGDPALEVGQALEVVGATAGRLAGHPVSRPVEHEHEREALAGGDLGQAVPLVGVPGADGAALDREVLGCGQDGSAVDRAETGDQGVAGQVVQPTDQRAQLGEAAVVEEGVEALAGVELALAVLALDPLGAAHGPGGVLAPAQVVQQRLPSAARRSPRHDLGSTGPRSSHEGDPCPTIG